ncbi:MAG: ketoacyl-ACP synthase III [Treponema sp.]|jgi:3-oxoacyl-[acyl-carrier-protein] synthase-3|nr:ketoacyl-ACP synthase III [Treponema sp.]
MAIEIMGTGKAVPARRVSNDDLAQEIETSDEWIRSHTGIGARHLADEDTACSDLALEAAKEALAMAAGWKNGAAEDQKARQERDAAALEGAKTLDLIVLASATQDYYGCPSTACVVQDKLGAKRAAAMDITAGCSGFVYSLETAAGLLSLSGDRKRALVIGSDILSKVADWNDRSTCVLFGDGAGAVILEKTNAPHEGKERRGLVRTILGADGSGAEYLINRRGGTRAPFKAGETVDVPPHLEMNGQAVYNFAVRAFTDTCKQLMEEDGIGIDDIAIIVPHQANARIVQAAGKRLGIPEEKFFLNIEEYANTSAASIPIALDELNRAGRLKRGDLILTVAFGGGLTYGGNLIVW